MKCKHNLSYWPHPPQLFLPGVCVDSHEVGNGEVPLLLGDLGEGRPIQLARETPDQHTILSGPLVHPDWNIVLVTVSFISMLTFGMFGHSFPHQELSTGSWCCCFWAKFSFGWYNQSSPRSSPSAPSDLCRSNSLGRRYQPTRPVELNPVTSFGFCEFLEVSLPEPESNDGYWRGQCWKKDKQLI